MDVVQNTKSFFVKCTRVWHALRKPSKQEYQQTAKVSAVGIVILGIIGFIVSIIMNAFIQ